MRVIIEEIGEDREEEIVLRCREASAMCYMREAANRYCQRAI